MAFRMVDGVSVGLLTDLYQLTMAYGYWRDGHADRRAIFHLAFRRAPFGGHYALAAGLADAIDFITDWRFDAADLAYLGGLVGTDGKPLFNDGFLVELAGRRFGGDLWAIPEGTAVFGYEPLLRVEGSLLECQILETALLNIINFQTLIATKAARVCRATQGEPVLEFGLRRAQGPDGGLSASRAAYIGGCAATSNVLAGRLFNIPVRGTHAHSWVMLYEDELRSFESYAAAMPNNCVFLVDTYDTLSGVENAIRVGHELRSNGHEMIGIRLDSGDLAELSHGARRLLDQAGFPQASIVASNDLDEFRIEALKSRGAPISVWGVGTRLATAYDQPALGGVYKLSAIEEDDGRLAPRIKLSEQDVKVSDPGRLQVRRYSRDGRFWGDTMFDELLTPEGPSDVAIRFSGERFEIAGDADGEDLLVPVIQRGRPVGRSPDLDEIRQRAMVQLNQLPPAVVRLSGSEPYQVGRELALFEQRSAMIRQSERATT